MTPPPIKFCFAPKKCLQAVQWMLATANEALDFQTIFKTAYFADKRMLNVHWRPIFGDTYYAMDYGPMPVKIYEMLISEPYHLSELDSDEYPRKKTRALPGKKSQSKNQVSTPSRLSQ